MIMRAQPDPVALTPGLAADDPLAIYWLRQATVRLRREICWSWRERTGSAAPDERALPPPRDRLSAALDLARYWEEKRQFFASDLTAAYLSDLLRDPPPSAGGSPRGGFGWIAETLPLDDVSAFVLALALLAAVDGAAGAVIGACLNDATRTRPTLELGQKLWDRPQAVMRLADAAHPLRRYGLLAEPPAGPDVSEWHRPLIVPPLVAHRLLNADSPLASGLLLAEPHADEASSLSEAARIVVRRLSAPAAALCVVPLRGSKGSASVEVARAMAAAGGRALAVWRGGSAEIAGATLQSAAVLCWLNGHALFISHDAAGDRQSADRYLKPLQTIPVVVFLGVRERAEIGGLPADTLLPAVEVPSLTYRERVSEWQHALGTDAAAHAAEIAECSRRFRYEKETIRTVVGGFRAAETLLASGDLVAACRAELPLDMGDLAEAVVPRFGPDELVLPHRQRLQFDEIFRAMSSLTTVHYGWGTAKAWNEGGISVLFAGPSGTGKTMAAEVLATMLDLPMYRIDLSQVVNKYIGETEKNLKRLFDAADTSDTLLFFDEADALFGRRSEVKDAHDRYANLEISYLLARMERFKGLAILATNRKKDLDEAFLRRLRYVIDFPLPEPAERKQIWLRSIPESADRSRLDVDFLAGQFQLAGGHIRSIVFNACLQTAASGDVVLTMERVVMAVKREYDKLNRSVGLDAFGPYAAVVERMDRG